MTVIGTPGRKRWSSGFFLPATRSHWGGRALRIGLLLTVVVSGTLTAGAGAAPRHRPSYGPDVVGRIGVGMVSPEAPLGIRYLTGYHTGFEVGVGMSSPADEDIDGTDVRIDGGVLLAMAPGHDVSFFLRPGIRFASEHRTAGTYSTVGFSIGFSFQWFVTRDFSLTATQGLRLDLVSPPDKDPAGSADRTRLTLFGGGVPHVGFFYYLPEF